MKIEFHCRTVARLFQLKNVPRLASSQGKCNTRRGNLRETKNARRLFPLCFLCFVFLFFFCRSLTFFFSSALGLLKFLSRRIMPVKLLELFCFCQADVFLQMEYTWEGCIKGLLSASANEIAIYLCLAIDATPGAYACKHIRLLIPFLCSVALLERLLHCLYVKQARAVHRNWKFGTNSSRTAHSADDQWSRVVCKVSCSKKMEGLLGIDWWAKLDWGERINGVK